MFVHAKTDPYALVPSITRIIRDLSADQPVEQAATLDDIRAEVLAPERLNALVFGGFALVALTIAVVGVAGVLAFSVSARTREFGIRLAIGSAPRHLLTRVLTEGAIIAAAGIVVGVIGGLILTRFAGGYIPGLRIPGALPAIAAAGFAGVGEHDGQLGLDEHAPDAEAVGYPRNSLSTAACRMPWRGTWR